MENLLMCQLNIPEIIVVEDDDADAKSLRRAFQKAKVANPMRRVTDGVEALSLLGGEYGPVPQKFIMLIDLNMPRLSGLELIAEIRRQPHLRKTIIFVLSTSKDERDISAAYDANVAGYVLKQSVSGDFSHLITTINSYTKVVEIPDVNSGSV